MSNVDPTQLVTNLIAGERLSTPTVKPIEPFKIAFCSVQW
jgi:hypothetical protein